MTENRTCSCVFEQQSKQRKGSKITYMYIAPVKEIATLSAFIARLRRRLLSCPSYCLSVAVFFCLSPTHTTTPTHTRARTTHTNTHILRIQAITDSKSSYILCCALHRSTESIIAQRAGYCMCACIQGELVISCKCTDTYWYSLSPRVYNLLLIIMNFHFKLKLIFQVNLRFLNVFWDLVLLCASERCSNNFLKNNSSIAYNSKTYDFTVPQITIAYHIL